MSCMAARNRRPAMVVNSPGTASMTSCPTRRMEISTTAGCHAYGRLISPADRMIGAFSGAYSLMGRGLGLANKLPHGDSMLE